MYVLLALFFVISLIIVYFHKKYSYWKNKKVPYVSPKLLFGNYKDYILLKKTFGETVADICEKLPDEPLIGGYFGTEPALIVQDPELIKLVFTKDFHYFNSRDISQYTHKEVVTNNLFFTYGDQWKLLRQNFTALFSSAKMKGMFNMVQDCCKDLDRMVIEETKHNNNVEVWNMMARYTMDNISKCAFGISSKTMEDNSKNNLFIQIGNAIFERSRIRGLYNAVRLVWPSVFYGLGFKIFPSSMNKLFLSIIETVKQDREDKPDSAKDFIGQIIALEKEKILTGDSISNLIDDTKTKVSLKFDQDMMIAMSTVFFGAGYETSATTSTFTLYELAKNVECQELVMKEVDEYLTARGGVLGYDCVSELPYLSACIDEVLRLYPVLGAITREVYQDYTLPNGLKLEKGLRIHVPVYSLQRNKKYFENPEEFRPERFFKEKNSIVPYTYLPFGEGPRICLGLRFAKMQILASMVTIFRKYRVELGDGMTSSIKLQSWALANVPNQDMMLKFISRK